MTGFEIEPGCGPLLLSSSCGREAGIMRRWAVVGLIVLSGMLVTTASAKKKKDAEASKIFCHAQYAYVETMDGDVMNPNVLPVDRDAANELMNNIQEWKRYSLVYQPNEADLVFVVRTGRLASAQGNAGVGGTIPSGRVQAGRNPNAGQQNPPGSIQDPQGAQDPSQAGDYPAGRSYGAGAEAGPPDDLLQVFTSGDVTDNNHTMLWERTQADGLQGSQPLFEHLRDAVEKGCLDSGKSQGGH